MVLINSWKAAQPFSVLLTKKKKRCYHYMSSISRPYKTYANEMCPNIIFLLKEVIGLYLRFFSVILNPVCNFQSYSTWLKVDWKHTFV